MATWSTGISLRGATGAVGPASLVTVTAPPGPDVGVVGGYAVQNNNGVVLLYGPKTSTGWPGDTNPTFVQLTGQAGQAGAAGANGATILQTTGKPADATGKDGDVALDFAQAMLWGPRTGGSWPAQAISLIGPAGPPSLPITDVSANSLTIAPISGDTTASAITQKSSQGATLFASDTSGNVQVAGTLKATGATTLAAAAASSLSVTGQSTLAAVTTSGNTSVGGALSATGASTLAAVSATNVTASGTLSVAGATSVAGITATATATAKNVVITSGGGGSVTFADGTAQTTAFTGAATGAASSRSVLDCGGYASTNTSPGQWTTAIAHVNANTTAVVNEEFFFKAPFAFSVTGWSLSQYVSNGQQSFQINKNRTSGTTGTVISVTNAGTANVSGFPGTQFSGTFAKGTYNFGAGDVLSATVGYASGASTNSHLYLTIEWI